MAEEYKKGTGTGRGGWRGGGRPKGSVSKKPKTNKTEAFTRAITIEEKAYLNKCLDEYRAKNGQ